MINDIKNKFKNYKPYINGYKNMKRASVLIPIVEINNTHIYYEVRSKNLKHQPSEISFPGGKIESGETPYEAVIRETCEELGTFSDKYRSISSLDLLITPVKLSYIHT
nr:NUDIX domain-containing protein [Clostridioides difficile]